MVGDDGEIEALFTGQAMKVLRASDEGDDLHVLLRDGQIAHVTLPEPSELTAGDIVLLGQERWEHVPAEVWSEITSITVVRAVFDDELLLEGGTGSGLRLVPRIGLNTVVGNTVEYSEDRGVLRIVSPRPIRSHERDVDDESLDRFKVSPSADSVSFGDFGGYHHVVERARELIETQLERREHLKVIGARPIKGILFTGPPGTGKTMLAKIIAQESGAEFFVVSGPEIVSKWLGDSEGLLRRIFETAGAAGEAHRAIIFFDEIDSVAEKRGGDTHEASKRLVAQFLTEMDGFDERANRNVIVIAATNRVHDVDPALLRPGRFDWQIEFGMPTLEDREEILQASSSKLTTIGDLPIKEVAARSGGWSAAKLTSIWTEAALLAAKADRWAISDLDFVEAFERVVVRPSPEEVARA
jgi:transitional endoplasmic reticulum ATPase